MVTAVGDGATAATELEKYAQKMQKKTGIKPELSVPEQPAQTEAGTDSSLFSAEMVQQLKTVFDRMATSLTLSLHLDDSPLSEELSQYMHEHARLTDKLTVSTVRGGGEHLPFVELLREDGSTTGLAFHGVPGGHEATSFVLGLYNSAGPGQPLSPEDQDAIAKLPPLELQVLVSLSCTMCPECVISAQHIAAKNPGITAHVYDVLAFPDLKDKYQLKSVPCVVVNGEKLLFGKKNVPQLLELLK